MNLNKNGNDFDLNINKKNTNNKKRFSLSSLSKIKGSTTLIERLKTLSKRDLAFLIVGSTILVTAPVAEYFLSKPQPANRLTSGFGERRPSSSTGIYEPGINALSAGSPDGADEVIAPLTARDPASLILGSSQEPQEQLPQVSAPPENRERDSLADYGRRAFSEAVKSSPAPFIPPKMNSTLRGFSSFFGSGGTRTSGRLSSGKILSDAKKAPTKAAKRSMLNPQAVPGYQGVASRTDSVNKGKFEQLRSQADKAAGFFSKDNAVRALEEAAKASVGAKPGSGTGGGGFGSVHTGKRGGRFSNNNFRNNWSWRPGDPCRGTLERQLACERARFWEKMKQNLITQAIDAVINKGIFQPVGEKIAKTTKGLLNPSSGGPKPVAYCIFKDGSKKPIYFLGYGKNGEKQYYGGFGPDECRTDGGTVSYKTSSSGNSGGSNSGSDESEQASLMDVYKGKLLELIAISKKAVSGVVSPEDKVKTAELSKASVGLGAKILKGQLDELVGTSPEELNEVYENTEKSFEGIKAESDKYKKRYELIKKCAENINNCKFIKEQQVNTADSNVKGKLEKSIRKSDKSNIIKLVTEAMRKTKEVDSKYHGQIFQAYRSFLTNSKMVYSSAKSKIKTNISELISDYYQMGNIANKATSVPDSEFYRLYLDIGLPSAASKDTGKLKNSTIYASTLNNEFRMALNDQDSLLKNLATIGGYEIKGENLEEKDLSEYKVNLPHNCLELKKPADEVYPFCSKQNFSFDNGGFNPSLKLIRKQLDFYKGGMEAFKIYETKTTIAVIENYRKKIEDVYRNVLTSVQSAPDNYPYWVNDILTGKYDNQTASPENNNQGDNTNQPSQPSNQTPSNNNDNQNTGNNTNPPSNTQPTTSPNQSEVKKKLESLIDRADNIISNYTPEYERAKQKYQDFVLKNWKKCQKNKTCEKYRQAAYNDLYKNTKKRYSMKQLLDSTKYSKRQLKKVKAKLDKGEKLTDRDLALIKKHENNLNVIKAVFPRKIINFNNNLKMAQASLQPNNTNNQGQNNTDLNNGGSNSGNTGSENNKPCYERKEGCSSVSSFYVAQRWKIKKQGRTAGIVYESWSGAEGQAWDRLYAGYSNKLITTREKEKACTDVWNSMWLSIRQYINLRSPQKGIENCNAYWFDPVFTFNYYSYAYGGINSESDFMIDLNRKPSAYKTEALYVGSDRAGLFNVELLCKYVNGKWIADTIAFTRNNRVSMSNSTSQNFSISKVVGISMGNSQSVSYFKQYGEKKIFHISAHNYTCGSDSDI